MANRAELEKGTGAAQAQARPEGRALQGRALRNRFGAFVAERHPFALADALAAFEGLAGDREPGDEDQFEELRTTFRRELTRRLERWPPPQGLAETTPRVS